MSPEAPPPPPRSAAIFWGAAERLDSELGPTQWRTEKPKYWPAPAVLADEEGLAAGRALATAEAVELAFGVGSESSVDARASR